MIMLCQWLVTTAWHIIRLWIVTFQIWRVAGNISKKQWQRADKGRGPQAWGLGKGLIFPQNIKSAFYKMYVTQGLGTGCFGMT